MGAPKAKQVSFRALEGVMRSAGILRRTLVPMNNSGDMGVSLEKKREVRCLGFEAYWHSLLSSFVPGLPALTK